MEPEDLNDKLNKAGQWASDKASQAVNKLAHVEGGAVKSGYKNPNDDRGSADDAPSGTDDSMDATKSREDNPNGLHSDFQNNVGKDRDKGSGRFSGKGKTKGKGKLSGKANFKNVLKKRGPLGLIIALLLGGGGLMLGSQTMEPFAIANRLIEEYNTMNISNNSRFNRMWKNLLHNGKKLPQKIADALAQEDIEVTTKRNASGGEETELTTTDEEGKKQTVKAEEAVEKTTFRDKIKSATKTTLSQAGGWFDRLAKKILPGRGISFSNWSDWDSSNDDEKTKQEKLSKKMDNPDNTQTVDEKNGTKEEKSGDDTKTVPEEEDTEKLSTKEKKESIGNKLKGIAAQAGIQAGCTLTMSLTAVSGIVMAQQTSDMINMAMKFLEAVQKVQAGDGAESPMNEIMSELNATNPDTGKSAMNSAGMSGLFGSKGELGETGNVENANLETVIVAAGGVVDGYSKCMAMQAGIAGVSLIISFIPIGGQIAKELKTGVKGLKKAVTSFKITKKTAGTIAWEAVKVLIPVATFMAMNAAIEKGAEIFVSNLATNLLGADAGDYIVSGANQIMATNHKGSGGSPGTEGKVLAFQQQKQAVLAEEADYDQRTKSPFDITSRYTFLGSLVYSMTPLANAISQSSVTKTLAASQTTLENSIIAISPTADAIATTDFIQTKGNCPFLESVGVYGDMYCNPYMTTDMSTMDIDVDTVKQKIAGNLDNVDSDTPTIKQGSELEQFYNYCGSRQSHYGLMDGTIAQDFEVSKGNEVIGFFTQFFDSVDFIDSMNKMGNMDWITGKNCVATEEPGFWQDKGKYFQRFLEDQRLMEDLGFTDKSSLTDLVERLEVKNPVDNSYEAQLARMSGLTKDQVTDTLALLDEYTFLANYDPTDLGPTPVEQTVESYDFTPSSVIAQEQHNDPTYSATNFAQHHITYADLRTRTQVA